MCVSSQQSEGDCVCIRAGLVVPRPTQYSIATGILYTTKIKLIIKTRFSDSVQVEHTFVAKGVQCVHRSRTELLCLPDL